MPFSLTLMSSRHLSLTLSLFAIMSAKMPSKKTKYKLLLALLAIGIIIYVEFLVSIVKMSARQSWRTEIRRKIRGKTKDDILAPDIQEYYARDAGYRKYFDEILNSSYLSKTLCEIPKMSPFSREVIPFFGARRIGQWCKESTPCEGDILTYIEKRGEDDFILKINESLVNVPQLTCCYNEVFRFNGTDDEVYFGQSCYTFTKKITIQATCNTIKVICNNGYENVHYIFRKPKPAENFDENKPNVLIIGIDSMSRLNLIRTMPRTVEFLIENNWLDFKGFNKVGDNTFPNLLATLAGQRTTEKNCSKGTPLDSCNLIWKDFKKMGYTTAYVEDWPFAATFNYQAKGFMNPPTDYYTRPYFLTHEYKQNTSNLDVVYCYGPENIGIRMTKFVRDYLSTVSGSANHFGLFWMNSFSHSDANCPITMDEHIADMFNFIKQTDVLNNTIVIFLSDHGRRWGGIVKTEQGWYENRLPFLYIWLPKMFVSSHPEEYTSIQTNTDRLISRFDLYVTLQDVLEMYHPDRFKAGPAFGCPGCVSLFRPISHQRTCAEAGIPMYWCVCTRYVHMPMKDPLVWKFAQFFTEYLNHLLESTPCAHYDVVEIYSYKVAYEYEDEYDPKKGEEHVAQAILLLGMDPPAQFEVFMNVSNGLPTSVEQMTRTDKYWSHVWCLTGEDVFLEKYCYCENNTVLSN